MPEIDWSVLQHLADAHSVTPILYMAVQRGELRDRFEEITLQSLVQSAEVARIAGILDRSGIAFVALKGPALSQYLYGTPGARASGDIDILVKPADVMRVRKILVGSNYRLKSPLHWDSDSACLRSRENEIAFSSPSNVSVDVHWRLIPRYYASAFDRLSGWESLETIPLAGRQIPVLAPEPLLLFLCAHGAKHNFSRLGWICDIARLLQVAPNLDWPQLIHHARRTASTRQLSLGVHLAAEILGAPASPVPKDGAVEQLVRQVVDRLMSGARNPPSPMDYHRFALRLLEKPAHAARYLGGQYLAPSEAEFQAVRLPPALFLLYYPLRPLRLFWKRAIAGNRSPETHARTQ